MCATNFFKQFHVTELHNRYPEPLYIQYQCCIDSRDIFYDAYLASKTIMSLCLSLARSTVLFKSIA